jgi:hypothetical protein
MGRYPAVVCQHDSICLGQGSFGDYAVHAGGRYQLSKTVLEPGDRLAVRKRLFPERLETGR